MIVLPLLIANVGTGGTDVSDLLRWKVGLSTKTEPENMLLVAVVLVSVEVTDQMLFKRSVCGGLAAVLLGEPMTPPLVLLCCGPVLLGREALVENDGEAL